MHAAANRARFGLCVAGTGHYVPEQVLDNEEVARRSGTDAAWILSRTGIRERRVASGSENAGTLAFEAARRALLDARLQANDLDLIIVATVTPEMAVPSAACLLQDRLGIGGRGVPAFDIVAGCSGFLYGLAAAQAHVQVGDTQHILLVGVDVLSRMTDYTNRNTAVLLGDGAGAVVLRRSDALDHGLLYAKMGADGSGHHLIYARGGLNRPAGTPEENEGNPYHLHMDGPRVFKLAVNRMRQLVEEALKACGLQVADVDLLIPHQANQRILEAVGERLQLPPQRVYSNIERYGNTSAASIPLAYDQARRSGRIQRDNLVVMVSFGAGLTWGSAVIREG